MRPPAIQYLSLSTFPSSAANAIQVVKMCEAFARQGCATRLHAFARKGAPKASLSEIAGHYGVDENFDLALYRKVRWRNWVMGLRAAGGGRDRVIYARNVIASYHASRRGRPVVLEIHHPYDTGRVEHGVLKRLSRAPQCLGAVAISHALKDRLAQDYPGFEGRILVAPDAASPMARSQVRDPQPRSRFQVGYVGSLYAGKGFSRIAGLAGRLPWATFHVIGEVEQLRQRGIDPESLPGNLVLHGYQPPSAMAALLSGFDAVLAPYRRQVKPHAALDIAPWMSPLKLFEYMAAAKPIVASDLPVIREVLAHETTALLCSADARDDGDWAAALERLADDPDLARRLAANAYDQWTRHYTWDARARKILAWIDRRMA